MKKKVLAFLMGTGLVLALAACGGGDKDNATGDTDTVDAEKITQQKCQSCHGENLTGGVGPNLSDVGSRLTKDQIKDVLEHGRGGMPAGLLSGDEEEAVADWLAAKK